LDSCGDAARYSHECAYRRSVSAGEIVVPGVVSVEHTEKRVATGECIGRLPSGGVIRDQNGNAHRDCPQRRASVDMSTIRCCSELKFAPDYGLKAVRLLFGKLLIE
jgi:hypothetical protein